jgi:hypothetical protein
MQNNCECDDYDWHTGGQTNNCSQGNSPPAICSSTKDKFNGQHYLYQYNSNYGHQTGTKESSTIQSSLRIAAFLGFDEKCTDDRQYNSSTRNYERQKNCVELVGIATWGFSDGRNPANPEQMAPTMNEIPTIHLEFSIVEFSTARMTATWQALLLGGFSRQQECHKEQRQKAPSLRSDTASEARKHGVTDVPL